MKYRRIDLFVDAVQWFPGVDLPGVERVVSYGGPAPTVEHVVDSGAAKLAVNPGDWVVTFEDGSVYPVRDSVFREMYEEAD